MYFHEPKVNENTAHKSSLIYYLASNTCCFSYKKKIEMQDLILEGCSMTLTNASISRENYSSLLKFINNAVFVHNRSLPSLF